MPLVNQSKDTHRPGQVVPPTGAAPKVAAKVSPKAPPAPPTDALEAQAKDTSSAALAPPVAPGVALPKRPAQHKLSNQKGQTPPASPKNVAWGGYAGVSTAAQVLAKLVTLTQEAKTLAGPVKAGQTPIRRIDQVYKEAEKTVELHLKPRGRDTVIATLLTAEVIIAFKRLAYEAKLGGKALKFLGVNSKVATKNTPTEALAHLAELARKDAGIKIQFPMLAESLCNEAISRLVASDKSPRALDAYAHAVSVKVAVLKDGTADQKQRFKSLPLFPTDITPMSPPFFRYVVCLALEGCYVKAQDRNKALSLLNERIKSHQSSMTPKGKQDTLAAIGKLKM